MAWYLAIDGRLVLVDGHPSPFAALGEVIKAADPRNAGGILEVTTTHPWLATTNHYIRGTDLKMGC